MIGCLDRPFLLAGGCVRCVWMDVFDCVIFLRLLSFLRTFLTQLVALRALRLAGNRAYKTKTLTLNSKTKPKTLTRKTKTKTSPKKLSRSK